MPSPRTSIVPLLLLTFFAACGTEDPPRLADAGPRPAEISRKDQRTPSDGAMLAAIGRQSFEGPAAFRCVLHEESGLQVNFRTGDPELPAVTVRIPEFQGSGPYRARLFVTGRSRTGALVTSTGDADVEMKEQDLPDGSAVALLSGSFAGEYGGQAGKGSIEGRFGACSYSAFRGGSPPSAGPAGAP
ncbi:MAG TPA: hypothetical protein VKK31_00135 [Thermoanaerobaculia bacterium]|nr:hypothetical protein [Thermoanaerobaculia bacterium]